ncbi:MAG: hypothetical protein C5S49_00600 [Candidatus Methanogaster sp.]|nr:MAG: hypothetical protein C5S49_00600 [ANME-2 cluster archaeon]
MNNNRHIKGRVALIMSLAAVLVLIAFASPISAVTVGTHNITFDGKTFDGDDTIWTYNVTSGSSPSLSHWSLEFCGGEADILKVSERPWEYGTDPHTGITGIKFEEGYDDGENRTVWFKLKGNWSENLVEVGTKAGNNDDNIANGSVTGPVCNVGEPIPEFTTIAIPVIALLGLLAFYRRKQKK